ncbi:MAG: hypothetical protein FJZ01_24615 [Candidatus Sericytochromatia bacterium]|nr:hypothetical protein [Candidatus Tanganyikabacteria bacterium]
MPRAFLLVGLTALLGACSFTTPPVDTPQVVKTFTLGDLWPSAPETTLIPVAVPVDLPPYNVAEAEGGIAIDVPAQARAANITSAVLHIGLRSQMKIGLAFKFFLAREKPYASVALAETTVQPGETKQVDAAFDTSLLKNEKVYAGVQAQVQKSDPAVVKKSDPLTTTTWATVQIKLF